MLGAMAALRRLTKVRRSPSERAALAGEAAADAAEQALREAAPLPPAAEQEQAGPPVDHPQGAAFFDCDNTILQGAAVFYLGVGLYRRNFFSRRDVAKFAWQQAWFRLHGTEDPGHIADAQHTALSLVAASGPPTWRRSARRSSRRSSPPRSGRAPGPWCRCTWTPGSGSGWSPPRRRRWPG